MAKHEIDIPAVLKKDAWKLKAPKNFYRGVRFTNHPLPDNILCFSPKGWHTVKAQHYRFVLILALESSGHAALDEHLLRMDEGQAILIFPFQRHSYVDMQTPANWLFITFEYSQPDHYRSARNSVMRIPEKGISLISEILTEYQKRIRPKDQTSNRLSLLLGLLLDHLISGPQSRKMLIHESDADARFLETVNRWIFSWMDQPVSVSKLANAMYMSESHLRLKFRERFKKSLGRYIREVKIHHAWSLLGTSNMRITDIAYACGYESLYTFSRTFKTMTGKTPKAYRESVKKAERLD